MTAIHFYYDAPDRLSAALAWLQQAWRERRQVLVYAPDPAAADALDSALWARPPTSFLPHCRDDSPLAAQTPVVIAARLEGLPHEEWLLNLSDEVPPGFGRFSRLVEIVSVGDDRVPARSRFKHYRDRGYAMESRKFSSAVPEGA